jgi:hypothetical protein
VWVHDQCWETWHSLRRRKASKALSRLGIRPAGLRVAADDGDQARRFE